MFPWLAQHGLSVLIFLPLAGAVVVLLLPRREIASIKAAALGTALVTLGFNVWLWGRFKGGTGFELAETALWIPAFNIYYRLGVDGVSFLLIALTNLVMPVVILSSWREIQKRIKEYMFLMLVLQTGMVGTFAALDLFLFYVFWEVMLVPMYFLIGVWGSGNRVMVAFKFVLYTLAGSLLMLVAILYGYFKAGQSFDLVVWYKTPFTLEAQFWLFLAFGLAFAIKVPIFPLHTWLPDAHTEAPTAGSVILAGILLKMGTYGFYRFAMPLFPDAIPIFSPWVIGLSLIGIVYGSLVAMVQRDVKRLVAYSSVAHLGFVMLGLFVLNTRGVEGAILQMINHGLSTGALFLLVGMIYERRHSRLIADYGGIAKVVPLYAFFFLFTTLASIGLPGLNNFVGEFLILTGTFESQKWVAVVAVTGMILAAVYMLWMVERVFFGPVTHEENRGLKDLGWREIAILVPLCLAMAGIGLYPKPLLNKLHGSAESFLKLVSRSAETIP